MRAHLMVATLAATAAALLAAPALAKPAWNVKVTITNGSCVLSYTSVSHTYTRIVFGVVNNGTVKHGFDIGTTHKTGLIAPGQESTLVANFGHPGAWRYACVAADSTVKKGVFTIRKA